MCRPRRRRRVWVAGAELGWLGLSEAKPRSFCERADRGVVPMQSGLRHTLVDQRESVGVGINEYDVVVLGTVADTGVVPDADDTVGLATREVRRRFTLL